MQGKNNNFVQYLTVFCQAIMGNMEQSKGEPDRKGESIRLPSKMAPFISQSCFI